MLDVRWLQSVAKIYEFAVNAEQDHPEFARDAPDNVAGDESGGAESNVTPAECSVYRRIVQLQSGPHHQADAAGRQDQETEKVDHLHERRSDHSFEGKVGAHQMSPRMFPNIRPEPPLLFNLALAIFSL